MLLACSFDTVDVAGLSPGISAPMQNQCGIYIIQF